MTPQVGFEPTTRRLTVVGSAAELLRNDNTLCSSAEGAPRGFPPLSHAGWIPILFSLGDVSTDVFQSVTPKAGFEPATSRLTVGGSATELLGNENNRYSSAAVAPRGIPPLTHMGWISDSFFSRRREYGRLPSPLSPQ